MVASNSRRFAILGGMLLLLVAAWGLGAALGKVSASHTPPTVFGGYSYTNSSCTTITDPVGTVFTFGSGAKSQVYDHAKRDDHGEWEVKAGGQYFYDNFGCSSSDGSAASNNGVGKDRYHMRYEVTWISSTGQSYAATPHFDDFDFDPLPTHCIRPPGHSGPNDPGGFVEGKWNLWPNWTVVNPDPHDSTTDVYWGNDELIQKCSNQYAQGDGYVDYIEMNTGT